MNYAKIILALFISVSLISCNKSGNIDTKDNKDNKNNTTQKTNTSDSTNKTNNLKFFKITKSEAAPKEKMAPEITWNENGKDVKLSDLKGNIVLINFWATWCKPCVGEMPDLSLISQELKDKNFKIYGISTEESKTIDNFLKTKPVDYAILNGTEETVDVFSKAGGEKIEGIPATYIINKEGKIVEFFVGSRTKSAFMDIIKKYL
jgi:peroxiredoxin